MVNSDSFIKQVIHEKSFKQLARNLDHESALVLLSRKLYDLGARGPGIVSVIGGAASGKTTFVHDLLARAPELRCAVIGTDDFVIGTRAYRKRKLEGGNPLNKYNLSLMRAKVDQILSLKSGETTIVPEYSERTGAGIPVRRPFTESYLSLSRTYHFRQIRGPIDLLVVEGDIQPLAKTDYLIYFHLSDQARFQNRLTRDMQERDAKDLKAIKASFELRQKLQHETLTLPNANHAHMILWARIINEKGNQRYRYSIYARDMSLAASLLQSTGLDNEKG